MSFDLAIWYPQKRISNKEASELYARLCENDLSAVIAHPAVDEFYSELIAAYPEINTVPEERSGDFDYCPWSCKLDRSPGHVIMSCVFSKAREVDELVENLARKHGLALFDPQSNQLFYADGSTGEKEGSSAVAMWILGFFALLFSAIFVYAAQINQSASSLTFYVFAGLCVLMAIACFRQALKSVRSRNGDGNRPQEN